jgi:hypothetical protein
MQNAKDFLGLATRIAATYKHQDVRILRIAGHRIGILLVLKEEIDNGFRYWHRLGICDWGNESIRQNSLAGSTLDVLNFQTDDWIEKEAHFG